jgi:hypothetical protein
MQRLEEAAGQQVQFRLSRLVATVVRGFLEAR